MIEVLHVMDAERVPRPPSTPSLWWQPRMHLKARRSFQVTITQWRCIRTSYTSVEMCNYTLLLIGWKGSRPALLIKSDTLTAVIVQRSLQVYKPLLVGRCVRVGVSVHSLSPKSLVHVSFCMIYLVSSYWTRNNPNIRGYVWCFDLKTVFPDFIDCFRIFTLNGKVIIVKV